MKKQLKIVMLGAAMISACSSVPMAMEADDSYAGAVKKINRIEASTVASSIKFSSGKSIKVHAVYDEKYCEYKSFWQDNPANNYVSASIKSLVSDKEDKCKGMLEIEAPKDVVLKINSVSGNIIIKGTDNPSEIRTVSGKVAVVHVNGSVDAESVSGDMQLSDVSGKVKIKTTSGNIKGDIYNDFDAKTMSGNMKLELAKKSNATAMQCDSVSGRITLAVPEKTRLNIELSSVSGKAVSDFVSYSSAPLHVKLTSISGSVSVQGQ